MTARPIGPHPMTTAVSLAPTWPRRTACSATAIGSVSAARSASSPLGTRIVIEAVTSTCSAYPPDACSLSPVRCTESPARRIGSATTGVPTGQVFLVRGP